MKFKGFFYILRDNESSLRKENICLEWPGDRRALWALQWEKIPKLASALGLGCKQVNLMDNVNIQLINLKLCKLFYIIFDIFFCPWKLNLFSLESIFSVSVFEPLTMIQCIKCFNIVVLFFV